MFSLVALDILILLVCFVLSTDSVQSAYSYTEEGRTWVAYDNEQSV
jgi:hypothetical protein